jgi:gamma-glutamyltranspeptidase/glutathione hydrolase
MQFMYRLLFPIILCAVCVCAAGPGTAPDQDMGLPSTTGLVVTTSSIASDAGAAVLNRGGNAVDAAVATAFALAVTHPSAGNIGGGGFMIVRNPSGKTVAFDYREKAPLGSRPDMYLDAQGKINRNLTSLTNASASSHGKTW